MARLRIDWRTRTEIAPGAAVTGTTATKEDLARTKVIWDKPMWIFIPDNDAQSSDMRKLEDVVFKNERVAIGAKFFDTFKVSRADAAKDRILKGTLKVDGPVLVFLRRDYSIHTVLNSHELSAGRILSAMSRMVRKNYEESFDHVLHEYESMLNERDRLESVRTRLDQQRQRYKDRPVRLAKVDKDQKEFEKDMNNLDKREHDLMSFHLRKLETSTSS